VAEPVPFVLYSAQAPRNNGAVGYNEKDAAKTGVVAKQAYRLMESLIEGRPTWTET
jgi:2,3-bisphosphoglycerate-independent phosphoglycerate mutase